MSLGDAISYDILGEKNRYKWGKQRLWGTVGFAVFSIFSAFSMDTLSSQINTNNFSMSFSLFSALSVATALLLCVMKIPDSKYCGQMMTENISLLRNPNISVLLLVVCCFGSLTGAIEVSLYWFLEDELGNNLKIIPGICLLCSCIGETPLLYSAGYLLKRFGHVKCLYAAFIAYALRFTMYAMLTNAWLVLPIELLHGFTFGLMWAAATSYGFSYIHQEMSGTIQGLLSGVYFGLGRGVGSLVTGQLYSLIGIRWTFRLYGISSILLVILYMLVTKFVFKMDRPVRFVEEVELITEECYTL